MRQAVCLGAVTVLYASLFLHSLLAPMVLAAPVGPGNDIELRLSALKPYDETVSGATGPDLFRRSGRGIANPVLLTGSSPTPILAEALQTLLKLKSDVLADRVAVKDKPNIEAFLRTLSVSLSNANEMGAAYPKEEIYNAVKDLVNRLINTWTASNLRRRVVFCAMKCLQQTTPPGGFAELPQEADLKKLSLKIESNDPSWSDKHHWNPLKRFITELGLTLEEAEKENFPYDKLVVDKALMDLRIVVGEWFKSKVKEEVLSAIDGCLALNWRDESTTHALGTTFESQSDTTFSCPATAPSTTPQSSHQNQHPPLSKQSFAELRMSRLLASPGNLKNIFLITTIMERVPDDACARRFDEWTFALVQMQNCVQKSAFTPEIQTWALESIGACKKTLWSKWDAYQTPPLMEALEKLVELKELARAGQMVYKKKQKLGAILDQLSSILTIKNDRSASYPREDIYNTAKELMNEEVNTWNNSDVKHHVIIGLMQCLQQTKPPEGFTDLPQQRDLNELSANIASDPKMQEGGHWLPLKRFLGELEWTLEQAGKVKFSYNKEVVHKALIDSKAMVETWRDSQIKRQVVLLMDKCLALIRTTEQRSPHHS